MACFLKKINISTHAKSRHVYKMRCSFHIITHLAACLVGLILSVFLPDSASLFAQARAQHKFCLSFVEPDSLSFYRIIPAADIPVFKQATDCRQWINGLGAKFYAAGFWAFSIDSLQSDSAATYAKIYVGEAFRVAYIRTDSIDKQALSKSGYRPQLYQNKPIKPAALQQLQHRLIDYYENRGYPFAQSTLSNIQFDATNHMLAANLLVNKGLRYRIDSLTLSAGEESPVAVRYLYRYLGIERGSWYNESQIKRMELRLRELPFLQLTKSPQVTFGRSNACIFLFLKRKRASHFDFLLGLQPSIDPQSGKQKYQLAGEGLLDLRNILGIGETIGLQFKNYPSNIRELKLNLAYPYLPLVPVGGEGRFELYLRDTLFRNISLYLGVQYLARGNNYWKAYFQSRTTDILSIDSSRLVSARQLPQTLDVKSTLYGLEWNMERLDYRLNPRKGWSINLNGSVGSKNVRANQRILSIGEAIETNFMAQYDSLNRHRLQWQATASLSVYLPLARQAALKIGSKAAYQSAQNIYENDLYRIGGNRLLRGFDEESILASMYWVGTVEMRYLLGQNSYTFIFADMAYLENKTNGHLSVNRPLGLGLGMTFETKVGIFALSYALGKQQGNPFDFRAGKVHLGYVSYF